MLASGPATYLADLSLCLQHCLCRALGRSCTVANRIGTVPCALLPYDGRLGRCSRSCSLSKGWRCLLGLQRGRRFRRRYRLRCLRGLGRGRCSSTACGQCLQMRKTLAAAHIFTSRQEHTFWASRAASSLRRAACRLLSRRDAFTERGSSVLPLLRKLSKKARLRRCFRALTGSGCLLSLFKLCTTAGSGAGCLAFEGAVLLAGAEATTTALLAFALTSAAAAAGFAVLLNNLPMKDITGCMVGSRNKQLRL